MSATAHTETGETGETYKIAYKNEEIEDVDPDANKIQLREWLTENKYIVPGDGRDVTDVPCVNATPDEAANVAKAANVANVTKAAEAAEATAKAADAAKAANVAAIEAAELLCDNVWGQPMGPNGSNR